MIRHAMRYLAAGSLVFLCIVVVLKWPWPFGSGGSGTEAGHARIVVDTEAADCPRQNGRTGVPVKSRFSGSEVHATPREADLSRGMATCHAASSANAGNSNSNAIAWLIRGRFIPVAAGRGPTERQAKLAAAQPSYTHMSRSSMWRLRSTCARLPQWRPCGAFQFPRVSENTLHTGWTYRCHAEKSIG